MTSKTEYNPKRLSWYQLSEKAFEKKNNTRPVQRDQDGCD